MRAAALAGASIAAVFGGVILFAVVAPEKTRTAVKSFEEATQFKLHLNLSPDECQKWEGKGAEAVEGCSKCAGFYPGRADQCMKCGGVCQKKMCNGLKGAECYESEPFAECHQVCMAKEFPVEKKEVDTKDCYFDEECHKLVDWDMVTETKMGFFARAKELKGREELRPLAVGLKERLVKAGMPEDRAWYIVKKWVGAVKEKMEPAKEEKKEEYTPAKQEAAVSESGCDKYAGRGELAVQGCKKCEYFYPGRETRCMRCGGACAKVCKGKDFAECAKTEEYKTCHLGCMDGSEKKERPAEESGCSKYAARGELAVDGCRKCAVFYPGRSDECMGCGGYCKKEVCEVKDFAECAKTDEYKKCHLGCMEKKAAAEEKKAVEEVAAPLDARREQEEFSGRHLEAVKDCYFDPECAKNVDWDAVTKAKTDFFLRAKLVQDRREVIPQSAKLLTRLVDAGVPEDRAKDMVSKWAKHLFQKQDSAKPDPASGETDEECAKYEGKGELAVRGCSKCAKIYPGRTDQCMTCGGVCKRKACDGKDFGECVQTAPFKECHRACMAEGATNVKWLKLKRLFSKLSNFDAMATFTKAVENVLVI
jgi:hypothetical protein